jgi:hypothetical protein
MLPSGLIIVCLRRGRDRYATRIDGLGRMGKTEVAKIAEAISQEIDHHA